MNKVEATSNAMLESYVQKIAWSIKELFHVHDRLGFFQDKHIGAEQDSSMPSVLMPVLRTESCNVSEGLRR